VVAVGAEGDGAHGVAVAGERLADGAEPGAVPELHVAVGAGGGDEGAVGREGDGVEHGRVAGVLACCAVGAAPQDQGAVVAHRGEGAAVGAEGDLGDGVLVADERRDAQGAAVGIAQQHALVGAGAGQQAAVGREGDAEYRALVFVEGPADGLAGGHVPQPYVAVGAGRGEVMPVRREGEAEHAIGVAAQRGGQAAVRLPQLDAAVLAAAGREGAVGAAGQGEHALLAGLRPGLRGAHEGGKQAVVGFEAGRVGKAGGGQLQGPVELGTAQLGGRLGGELARDGYFGGVFGALPEHAGDAREKGGGDDRDDREAQGAAVAVAVGLCPALGFQAGLFGGLCGIAGLAAGVEKTLRGGRFAAVLAGPGGGGLAAFAPVEGELEFRVAPQAGLAGGVEFGSVGQAAQHAGGVGFALAPFAEAVPDAHEAFVGEVDDGVGAQCVAGRGHQEGGSRRAEGGEGGGEFVVAAGGDGGQIGEAGGAADAAAVGAFVGEGAKGGGAALLAGFGERAEDFFGVLVEGVGEGADGVVVAGLDGARLAAGLPVGPAAGQGVLEQRELVGVVAHVVDEAGEQGGGDVGAAHPRRALDGGAAFVAAHARHEVLAAVDGFGQAGKAGAVAEKIGAHGEDDVDRDVLGAGFEQQVDEGGGGVAVFGLVGEIAVAEELFELVDDEQQAGAVGQRGLVPGFDQAAAAHGEGGFEEFGLAEGAAGGGAAEGFGRGQCGGEGAQRVAAGPATGHAPGAAGPGEQAPVQGRAQAAIDEGGFAAAGAADDGQEAATGEGVHHCVHLGFAAEEEKLFVFAEGADAGVGRAGLWVHELTPSARAVNRGARVASSRLPRASITSGSARAWRTSLSSLAGGASRVRLARRGRWRGLPRSLSRSFCWWYFQASSPAP
jgi:hypothetical protein